MSKLRNLLVAAVAPTLMLAAASSGSGFVTGTVLDDQGKPVPNAFITLENRVSGHRQAVHADAKGRFALYNVPFNDYHLEAKAPGLNTSHNNVAVHSNLPIQLNLRLLAASAVVVVEEKADPLEGHPSSHIDIDHTTIEQIPAVVQSRGMESIILETPGVIQDENGRFHFRGSHGQVMYVIDGVPVTDQVQATFSNSLDPAQVEGMEIITGGVSAEYGGKPGAVVNLTTKSGLGTPNGFEGNISVGTARFNTFEMGLGVKGCTDRFGYFVTAGGSSSDRFLDPVNFENLHNHGATGRIYTRFDWLVTDRDTVRLSMGGGSTSRDVVNLASQQAQGQNQRVRNVDNNVNVGWTHLLSPESSIESALFYRHSTASLDPSGNLAPGFQEGGPDYPFWASQVRSLDNQGVTFMFQQKHGEDGFKAGVQYVRYPIHERFNFAITDNSQVTGTDDPLYPYTPQGGGNVFRFDEQLTPTLASAFVQEDLKAGNWNLGLGLRLDSYHGRDYVKNQLQPRLGATYAFPGTSTLIRFSYDRLMITPENENLAFSTSQLAWNLTTAAGTPVPRLNPEIQDSYLVGLEHQFGKLLKATLDYWWKDSTNSADNDQFLNTGVLFPIAAAKGRFHGLDLRLDLMETHGWSGYVSAGTVRTIFYSPTVGGLSSADPTINGPAGTPYLIDHDEKLTLQVGLRYKVDSFYTQVVGRYDSGLEAGDPSAVVGNPDYAFGIPYVRVANDSLVGPTFRIKPRTIWNLSLGQEFKTGERTSLEAAANLLNVFDEKGLYNFLSTFGGTHVIPPRTLAVHLKFKF
jgi:outer membrane receptor for Fe3+-dicitrate